jgi:hypothetical protein
VSADSGTGRRLATTIVDDRRERWNRKAERREDFEDCSAAVIRARIEVHRHLWPGLLVNFRESALKNGLRGPTLSPDFSTSCLPVNLSKFQVIQET